MGDMLTMNSLGDGSTLNLDFTTGVLDPRLTFTRASTATYINSSGYVTSAAINAPRFDYSPTTIGEPRGLLIEGESINLINWSESFEITGGAVNWNWSVLNVTRGTVTTTNPTGAIATVVKIQETNGTGLHATLTIPPVTASTVYTFSVYAKAAERTFVQLWDNGGSTSGCMVNLSTGAVVSVSSGASASVTAYGTTGWYRISLRFTTIVGQTTVNLQPRLSTDGTATSYTGTTGSGIYIWGAQLELGSASSYIPTGASGVTRNADSCLMSGTNFSDWFTTAGTLLIEHQLTNAFGSNDRAQFSLGQYSPGIVAFGFFRTNATTVGAAVWGSGGTGYQEGTSVVSARTPIRSGMTLNFTGATRSLRAFANGTAGASLISTTGTISVDRMFIGSNGLGTSSTRDYQNGHIRSLKFWPSVLPNDQLQTLTAS